MRISESWLRSQRFHRRNDFFFSVHDRLLLLLLLLRKLLLNLSHSRRRVKLTKERSSCGHIDNGIDNLWGIRSMRAILSGGRAGGHLQVHIQGDLLCWFHSRLQQKSNWWRNSYCALLLLLWNIGKEITQLIGRVFVVCYWWPHKPNIYITFTEKQVDVARPVFFNYLLAE